MVDPISVVVRRGDVVEATHRVHAVAVEHDGIDARVRRPKAGHAAALVGQAVPGATAGARFRRPRRRRELAIASASHRADPGSSMRSRHAAHTCAPPTEDDLECGPAGRPPSRLNHNCSGKHAGMLAACRANGWSMRGLPARRSSAAAPRSFARSPTRPARTRKRSAVAVDGCGVLTFALTLARWRRCSRVSRARRKERLLRTAMRAHPELLRGPDGTDTCSSSAPGAVAKGGAEGLFCGTLPNGIGFARNVEDGSSRALRPALARLLGDWDEPRRIRRAYRSEQSRRSVASCRSAV